MTNEQEYTELAQNLLYSYVNTPYNENMNTMCEDYFVATDGNHADELQPQCMEIWQLAEVSCNCDSDMLLHVFEHIIIEEPQIFYSHSDHLGSASWITDMTGTPVQYIHYMPYGEQLVYQTLTDYDERFKFTGKEHDDETGYDFFGARYHASALPSWLSVDPLADKYPGISPYAYCNWNPVKYIDPDGRIIIFAPGTTPTQKKQFWQTVRYLDSNNCGGRFGQLKNSRYTYTINMNAKKSQFLPNKQTINWLPQQGIETDNGVIISPATVLNHEMTHATHYDNAIEQYNAGNEQAFEDYKKSLLPNTSENYNTIEEESVIIGIEQRTAQMLGEIAPDEVTRTNHKGTTVKVESPISNKKVNE